MDPPHFYSYYFYLNATSFPNIEKLFFTCRAMPQLWDYVMEVIVNIGKTNTMTIKWGKTKPKTDKDKNVVNKRITVRYSSRLQRHPVTIF